MVSDAGTRLNRDFVRGAEPEAEKLAGGVEWALMEVAAYWCLLIRVAAEAERAAWAAGWMHRMSPERNMAGTVMSL